MIALAAGLLAALTLPPVAPLTAQVAAPGEYARPGAESGSAPSGAYATPAEGDLRISLFFGGGSYYLFPEESARLQAFLDAIPGVATYGIEIQGHTDDIGDRAYNLRLSQLRAAVVREHLLAYPVPADLIETLPLGEGAPAFDNATWEGKLSNRRVDVILKPVVM